MGGRRAYALARAGETPELAEREVCVHAFTEVRRAGDRRSFVIECSSGTYVRTLIAELGDAYCETLRRTRIGAFDVADADPERPVALDAALAFLPEVALDAETGTRAGHGQAVAAPAGAAPITGTVRLTDPAGLVALAQPGSQPGTLRPILGLRG